MSFRTSDVTPRVFYRRGKWLEPCVIDDGGPGADTRDCSVKIALNVPLCCCNSELPMSA